MGALPPRPPGGRNPELLQTEPGNKAPARCLWASGRPQRPRDEPMEPFPKSRPASGAPASPTGALSPKNGTPTARGGAPALGPSVCHPGARLQPRGTPPQRLPPHSGSPTVHQSSHILVTSPQVSAELGAAGGCRGGRRARSAGAVGAGTRGAAAGAGGRGRGGSRPAVAWARQPAPSGRPQPRTRHARSSPSAEPSARRPVRRPPTERPPRWPRAPHQGWPMGAARGAWPANGRALWPGGREVPGRGGSDSPAPSPESSARLCTLRPPSVATAALAAPSVPLREVGGPRNAAVPARLRTAGARRAHFDLRSSFSPSAPGSFRPSLYL